MTVSQRPKVQPIRDTTLFEMEKVDEAAKLTSELTIERPFSLPGTGILLVFVYLLALVMGRSFSISETTHLRNVSHS